VGRERDLNLKHLTQRNPQGALSICENALRKANNLPPTEYDVERDLYRRVGTGEVELRRPRVFTFSGRKKD